MAKEVGLDETLRDRPAVDRDHRARAPRKAMDRASQDLFARAGFAGQSDRDARLCNLRDEAVVARETGNRRSQGGHDRLAREVQVDGPVRRCRETGPDDEKDVPELNPIAVFDRTTTDAVAVDVRPIRRPGIFQDPALGRTLEPGVKRRQPAIGHSDDQLPLTAEGAPFGLPLRSATDDDLVHVTDIKSSPVCRRTLAFHHQKQVRPHVHPRRAARFGALLQRLGVLEVRRFCACHEKRGDSSMGRSCGVRCLARMLEGPTPSIGRTIGSYRLARLIGRGGMGTVYEAVHEKLEKRVALKCLHARYAEQRQAQLRFEREARVVARCRHPHVVNVFDCGEADGCPFLVMDLIDGPTLAQYTRNRGAWPLPEIVEMFLPIASAVYAAHEAGIVHRDVKPANVLVAAGPGGRPWPMVVDFGISRLIDEEDPLTRSEAIVGTLPYLPPELARDPRLATPEVDQYALGVMLYECATARRPFTGVSPYELLHAIVTSSPPSPSEINPLLPPEFDLVVRRAMARDPSERYPSVHALASALLSFGTRRAWLVWGGEFAAAPAENRVDVTGLRASGCDAQSVISGGITLVTGSRGSSAVERRPFARGSGRGLLACSAGCIGASTRGSRTALPPAGWRRRDSIQSGVDGRERRRPQYRRSERPRRPSRARAFDATQGRGGSQKGPRCTRACADATRGATCRGPGYGIPVDSVV